jgi:hypothetical protein
LLISRLFSIPITLKLAGPITLRLAAILAFAGLTLSASGAGLFEAAAEAAPDDSANQAIVNKFLDASKTQQEHLRGAKMEVRIAAELPRLAKKGEMKALRSISKLGKITYEGLGFSGDNTIKSQVISRFISEDMQHGEFPITLANYKFKHKATIETGSHRVEVFQLTPRRKAEGLFRGELWLDAATGMPVREAGRLVKPSSIFLKKIEFVSNYEIQDGVALPKHFESTVDTRLVGRAELSIDFSNFSRLETTEDDAEELAPVGKSSPLRRFSPCQ